MSLDWQVVVITLFILISVKLRRTKQHPPYPPGPPTDLLIGNLRQIPTKEEDVQFCRLAKKYGDIVHLQFLGRHIIVLSSAKIAADLLEKRSSIYGGRPRTPLVEVLGLDISIAFIDANTDRFGLHRRLLQKYLQKDNVKDPHFRRIWAREALGMVRRIILAPEVWDDHILNFSTAVILEIISGHEIASDDDFYLKLASDVRDNAVPAVKPPGGSAVDVFPILKRLPSWFPGGYWIGRARVGRVCLERLGHYPVEDTMARLANGTARPSFLLKHLADMQNGTADPALNMEHLKSMSISLYLAGVETTTSTISNIVAAIFLHPECQKEAQDEIEAVIGSDRLPDYGDRESLPFLDALINEAVRWHPILPLGIPRVATSDDVYEGMFIPEGSVVIANARAMGQNEEVYRDPQTFNPSRYLPAPRGWGEPPLTSIYGSGRRICPGRFLVDEAVWIAVATILSTVTIMKPVGEDGVEYTPNIVFEQGLSHPPARFPFRLRARNTQVERLMDQIIAE